MTYSDAVSTAEIAQAYNFDELIRVFTTSATPQEIRQGLTDIYFTAVELFFNEGTVPGAGGRSAFYILQSIIQALESVNDITSAKLKITPKGVDIHSR